MASSITSLVSTISVDEVERVVITDQTTQDDGSFVRAIKIYGTPSGVDGDPVLILQIVSPISSKIAIHAPGTSF